MANTTFNAKTSKKGLVEFLRGSVKSLKDNNLIARVKYALKQVEKDEKAVAKSDLYDLAKEISGILAPAPKLAVENSPKPKLGKKKSAEPVEEAPVEEEVETEEEAPAPKKKTTKKVSKPKKKEAPAVETTEGLTSKDLPMAKIFPKEIDHESLGKLVACPDKYHTIGEIRTALDEGVVLIFACYWTKRHIKEFSYGQSFEVPTPKKGFPYDLDTLQALYVCEGMERIYALSTYTEAMFRFNGDELEPVECKTNDGEEFLMRYSAGLEFEIYEVVEDAE